MTFVFLKSDEVHIVLLLLPQCQLINAAVALSSIELDADFLLINPSHYIIHHQCVSHFLGNVPLHAWGTCDF